MINHSLKWLLLLFLVMKPLIINEFKGPETVKTNNTLSVNTVLFSKVKAFEGTLSKPHFSLKLPISGVENYVVNNKKYQVDNTSYLITNADKEIEAFVKSDNAVSGLCILFSKTYISNLVGSISQKIDKGIDNPFNAKTPVNFITNKNRIKSDNLGRVLNKVKQDLLENKIRDHYEEEQFYLSLGELLINNQFKIYSDIKRLPYVKMSTKEEVYRRVRKMNHYIQDNYKTNINIEELSQISCLSKFHAIRCYQYIYGISPYQKIQKLRLEDAKQLINLGMPIKDVANETNFTDHRALSKQFKRHFNMTPTEFRLKNLKTS